VLVGRTAVPDDAERLAHGDKRLRRILGEIEEMTELGAQVRTMACDIGDPRQVSRVLDVVSAKFGPVNGILHLAGVAGDGMLQLRASADARAVLHPKVRGTLVLQEALQGRPALDFFVSFSSRAALAGLVGSGDYAAANAALDAFAAIGQGSCRWLSINWPAWSSVGMAVDTGRPAGPDSKHVELTLDPEQDWVLDEHRLNGRAVLPGTGHLNLVLTSFRKLGLINPDDAIQLEDIVFKNALVVDAPRDVQVRFRPGQADWQFEVRSRPSGAGTDQWSQHADGRISGCARKDELRPPEPLFDGFREVEPPSLKPGPGRLFTLGERWQNIERMWRDDDRRERAVRLVLPAGLEDDLGSCQAHPALLDGATAVVRDDADDLHLPFMYRRAVFHRPFPPVLFSHATRHPDKPGFIVADITVVAPDGSLLAEIEGYTMRKVSRQLRFLDEPPAGPAAPATAGAEPVAQAPAATVWDVDGIDPDEGGRLLTELLGARTPRQVLVRPYANGRPVPVPARSPVPAGLVPPAPEPVSAPPGLVPVTQAQAVNGSGPRGEAIEAEMYEMWKEALGVETLRPDDEFFELGGDSLSAVQLMRRVREQFGVELGISVLFDCPTVQALAAEVTRLAAAA
jgi:acyl carrier protein